MTLYEAPFNKKCKITKINIIQQPERQRFLDLGLSFFPIVKEKTAPLGDPVLIKILNTSVAIRNKEARMIEIILL